MSDDSHKLIVITHVITHNALYGSARAGCVNVTHALDQ
jgi:hypothetical protein